MAKRARIAFMARDANVHFSHVTRTKDCKLKGVKNSLNSPEREKKIHKIFYPPKAQFECEEQKSIALHPRSDFTGKQRISRVCKYRREQRLRT